ncbi:MAG: FAD-binding oxidoreductase [Alphaproteobacteria bacterium]|nr:FAD-binding oxidoreductase [Alphaproteobacteria bacterium]
MRKSHPPPATPAVAVLGAGIVGACVALVLQRAGRAVELFDPAPPGSGTTGGNAGLISADSCMPLALPGQLMQLPGWLMDRDGPLAIAPGTFVREFRWFWLRLRQAAMPRVLQISDAMRAMHRGALGDYRWLLGEAEFARQIHTTGQWHVQQGITRSRGERVMALLRERQGLQVETVGGAELHARLPGLAKQLQLGLLYHANAHATDPMQLARALVDRFVAEGGQHHELSASALRTSGTAGLVVSTPTGERRFDQVVVCAGPHSRGLLRPLGLRLPLVGERGYYVQLAAQAGVPSLPVLFRDAGFVLTPMAQGPRLAGKVDFGPPNMVRAHAMLRQAQTLWPTLRAEGAKFWTGERPSTPDNLPILGAVDTVPGLFLACGHGHYGLTAAPMSARLVAAAMGLGTAPIDARPYALVRFA